MGIQKVVPFTTKQSSLPNLQGVFISAIDSSLILRSTNLELGVEIEIPAKIESPGSFLVPGDVILKVFSNLSTQEKKVTLSTEGNTLHITSSQNNISLLCLSFDDFPTIPKISGDSYEIPIQKVIEGFSSVYYSASISSIKPEIASVYIYTTQNELIFVATDSFRLAEKKIKFKAENPFSIIIPLKSISEIIKLFSGMDDVFTITTSKSTVSFSTSEVYMTSRLIEGTFPDYRQIIPKEGNTEITVLKQDLVSLTKLLSVFSDRFGQVVMEIEPKKKAVFSTSNSLVGDIRHQIDASVVGEGVTIHFNYKYLQDVLPVLYKESIVFQLTTPQKPILVKSAADDSFTYLIMPLNR